MGIRRGFAFVFGVGLPFAAAMSAQAAEVYTYTGNDYTSTCSNTGNGCTGSSPYTTSDSITGSITLTNPLAGDLTGFTVDDIADYSFNDGIGTMWNPGDSIVDILQVGTDAQGNINNWELLLTSSGGDFGGIVLVTCGGTGLTIAQCSSVPEDFADISVAPTGFAYGFNQNDPGTWSTAAATASPEPSSFGLVALGALLCLLSRWGLDRRSECRSLRGRRSCADCS